MSTLPDFSNLNSVHILINIMEIISINCILILLHSGYYPVSSYGNGVLDNQQLQPQQPGDVRVSQSLAGVISTNVQNNSEKIKTVNHNSSLNQG